jgi:hypothetical protein
LPYRQNTEDNAIIPVHIVKCTYKLESTIRDLNARNVAPERQNDLTEEVAAC